MVLVDFTLGCVFMCSAVAKAARPSTAATGIAAYGAVPQSLARPLSVCLICVEATIAGALLLSGLLPGSTRSVAMLASGLLFACFAIVIAKALRRRVDATCGCLGGVVELHPGKSVAILNLAIAALAVVAALGTTAGPTVDFAERVVMYEVASLVAIVYWLFVYGTSVSAKVSASMTPKGTI